MTISEAIAILTKQRERVGDVDVWFDCPHCDRSFAPNKVVALAMHITEGKPAGVATTEGGTK